MTTKVRMILKCSIRKLLKRTETEKETHKIKIKVEIDRDQGHLTSITQLHTSDLKVELLDTEQREAIFQIVTNQSLMETRRLTREMNQDPPYSPERVTLVVVIEE